MMVSLLQQRQTRRSSTSWRRGIQPISTRHLWSHTWSNLFREFWSIHCCSESWCLWPTLRAPNTHTWQVHNTHLTGAIHTGTQHTPDRYNTHLTRTTHTWQVQYTHTWQVQYTHTWQVHNTHLTCTTHTHYRYFTHTWQVQQHTDLTGKSHTWQLHKTHTWQVRYTSDSYTTHTHTHTHTHKPEEYTTHAWRVQHTPHSYTTHTLQVPNTHTHTHIHLTATYLKDDCHTWRVHLVVNPHSEAVVIAALYVVGSFWFERWTFV